MIKEMRQALIGEITPETRLRRDVTGMSIGEEHYEYRIKGVVKHYSRLGIALLLMAVVLAFATDGFAGTFVAWLLIIFGNCCTAYVAGLRRGWRGGATDGLEQATSTMNEYTESRAA